MGLGKIYQRLKGRGLDKLSRKFNVNLYKLHDYINNRSKKLTIKSLKEIKELSSKFNININIEDLEKNVVSIKSGRRSNTLILKTGFPIKLDTKEWAFIFGVIPDSHLKKFTFYSKEEKFIKEITDRFSDIGINSSFKQKDKGFKIGSNRMISLLMNLAGFNFNKRQITGETLFPYWFLETSNEFQSILLSKIIDTEGNIGTRMLRISQSNLIELSKEEIKNIKTNGKSFLIKQSNSTVDIMQFSKLSTKLKNNVMSNPPSFLIFVQILLMKNKIYSVLYPLRISITRKSIASQWNLGIYGYENLSKVDDMCSKYSILKKDKLKDLINSYKQNHLPKNVRFNFYISKALEIQGINGYFTSKDLIYKTNKSKKNITNVIGELSKLNLIELHEKEGKFKHWKITEEGLKYNKKNTDFNSLDLSSGTFSIT